jgi:hypothetical protein
MEIFGIIACALILSYSSLPGEVNKVKQSVKKLEKNFTKKEVVVMSKMLEGLKGQNCILTFQDHPFGLGSNRVQCYIIDVEEEWIKFSANDKKGRNVTKMMRIEKITEVEM